MGIFDDIGSFLGFGGNQNTPLAPQGMTNPGAFQAPPSDDWAIQGPMAPQAGPQAGGGGFIDITGDTAAGVRGDEVMDTIDLAGFILQGAGPGWVRMEARRRKYTKADFNAVTRVRSSLQKVAEGLGMNTGGVLPNPAFMQVMAMLSHSLRGKRRKKKNVSLPRMLIALRQASALARLLHSAGSGLARLARPRVEMVSRAPAHLAAYQFRRKVASN